jgi:predicted nucleotidyltransferase
VRVLEADWNARRDEVRRVLDLAVAWARSDPTIIAVGLAGSEARGDARLDSDVDLIVLVQRPERWLADETWYRAFGDVRLVRAEQFGVLAERRLRLPSGLDIEVGIVPPSWAANDRVDPGTQRVVRDGFQVLYEQDDVLSCLVRSVDSTGT